MMSNQTQRLIGAWILTASLSAGTPADVIRACDTGQTARGGGRRQSTVQRLRTGQGDEHRVIFYLLTCYLPRFLDHTFREKLVTIFHELYHISPLFDGDLRRMGGRYHVHSHSQKEYDRLMDRFADRYLALSPPRSVYNFLKWNFRQLETTHGGVIGLQVPIPKLIPIPDSNSA